MRVPNNSTVRSSAGKLVADTSSEARNAFKSSPKEHVVPAAHGYAFKVKAGERFRVVDIHGEQVVDFAAWVDGTNLVEKLSMSYTRYHLNGVTPAIGECLWTNKDEPLLKITDDTVHVHDMTFMSCFPEMYEKRGFKGHRSCAGNIAEVMKEHGMGSYLEITDPFNIFQNTPNYSLKRLGCSKKGDYLEFEACKDAICAVSSCPWSAHGFNGGKITDIAVVTGL
ncbi:hypothetical protein LTR66_003400 [Elasticomyces elasticus]|nr:hypothetical protein LTR50_004106 [Elasticomyces elasticus]KAK4997144.1 hypothetical protein LTR66_003400 [Elasticomyces elasticus]